MKQVSISGPTRLAAIAMLGRFGGSVIPLTFSERSYLRTHSARVLKWLALPLPRRRAVDISWTLYLVGSLLVFGSWVDLVPTGLGWIGWLMALGGWAIGGRHDRRGEQATALTKAEQIEKLDLLRHRGVITEDEFQEQKRQLLHSASESMPVTDKL